MIKYHPKEERWSSIILNDYQESSYLSIDDQASFDQ